jgi:hypothetical protein
MNHRIPDNSNPGEWSTGSESQENNSTSTVSAGHEAS